MKLLRLNRAVDKYSKDLNLKSRASIAAIGIEKSTESGGIELKPHQPGQSEYILLNGTVQTFLLNPEGGEIKLYFFEDNSVFLPYVIRSKNRRSPMNVQALTDCTFTKIDAIAFESFNDSQSQNLGI